MSSIEAISEAEGIDEYELGMFVSLAKLGIEGINRQIRKMQAKKMPENSNIKIIKEDMHNMVSYTITELSRTEGEEEEEEELGKIWFSKRGLKSVYIGIIKRNNNNNDNQRIVWIKMSGDEYTIVPYAAVIGGRRRSTKRNKRRSHKHRK